MFHLIAINLYYSQAHTKVIGSQVDRIIMQASMQARAYEPKISSRHVIGDWLIGPVQRLDQGRIYTKERSHQEYLALIEQLTTFKPNRYAQLQFFLKKKKVLFAVLSFIEFLTINVSKSGIGFLNEILFEYVLAHLLSSDLIQNDIY